GSGRAGCRGHRLHAVRGHRPAAGSGTAAGAHRCRRPGRAGPRGPARRALPKPRELRLRPVRWWIRWGRTARCRRPWRRAACARAWWRFRQRRSRGSLGYCRTSCDFLADASARNGRTDGRSRWVSLEESRCGAGWMGAADGWPEPRKHAGAPKLAPCRRRGKRGCQGRAVPAGCRQRALSIIWLSWALPTAPIWVAWTCPSLNSSNIGIDRTWYFMAVLRFWSMSTFTTLALPAYSAASWSRAGAIILQGPHHCAQKSTSTGSSDCRTALSKSASVAWITVSFMGSPGWKRSTRGGAGLRSGGWVLLNWGVPRPEPSALRNPRAPTGRLLRGRLPRKRAAPAPLPATPEPRKEPQPNAHERQATHRYRLFLLRPASDPAFGPRRRRLHPLHPHPGDDAADHPRRARRRRPGADRHRQDPGVPGHRREQAAHAAGPGRAQPGGSARADPGPDPRARDPDPQGRGEVRFRPRPEVRPGLRW